MAHRVRIREVEEGKDKDADHCDEAAHASAQRHDHGAVLLRRLFLAQQVRLLIAVVVATACVHHSAARAAVSQVRVACAADGQRSGCARGVPGDDKRLFRSTSRALGAERAHLVFRGQELTGIGIRGTLWRSHRIQAWCC